MSDTYAIRPMRPSDLDRALAWAKAEGWNPGRDDAAAFHAADPSGFLMGWLGETPVSCISVVKYGTDFAFLGLYIVHPDFRGRGLGKAIWDAGLTSAAGRTIGLDGVVAQQANYRISGFAFAHRNIRLGGRPVFAPAPAGPIQPIGAGVLGAVMAYDSRMFPAARQAFLAEWLSPTPGRQGAAWVENGIVRGYGVIRACDHGHKIGPLFADSAGIATALLAHLCDAARPDELYIDVPEPNAAGATIATRLGLAPVFETARMYRGPAPALPLERIFGLTSLELG